LIQYLRMEVQINSEVEKYIHQHAENTYPFECCGFMYGKEKNGKRIIERAIEVVNSKKGDQRKRFEVSPHDYLRAENYAEIHDMTLLGIYHSHPDHPAVPSRHDHKQAVPFFLYTIVSVRNGRQFKTTSWQLNDDGNFVREKTSIEAEKK